MKILKEIEEIYPYYKNIRRELHKIPEIGFEEFETSKLIQKELDKLEIEYESGIAKTGIIAWIKSGTSEKNIAFRADMDALVIEEKNTFDHCSTKKGMMHACGHDGHVATLLAFAKVLTLNKDKFNGTIYLIFQPAEEGLGGARVMIEEGLLERYRIDKIFSAHNRPTEDFGKILLKEGVMMASYDNYRITVKGKSTHSSMPQTGKNPIIAAAHIVSAINSISSLDISPLEKSVVTVASINGGEALNIVPEKCEVAGSIRAYKTEVREDIEKRIKQIAKLAKGFGMEAEIVYTKGYPPTINSDIKSAIESAKEIVGKENVIQDFHPSFGAEDFSYFLEKIPGCYAMLGSRVEDKERKTLHNSGFDFNDELIKVGATYFFNIALNELQ